MSIHNADYSSTPCLCLVIMLITPAHSVYVQSSCWVQPSCSNAFSISLCRTPCIFCVSTSLNAHYLKFLYIMRILLGVKELCDFQHVGRRGWGWGWECGGVSVRCGVLSQLGYYSISGMRIPAVHRLTACGLEKYMLFVKSVNSWWISS